MRVRVKLPPGDLIEYGSLCRAISQAVAPADEQQLEGMACIIGKSVRIQTAMPPPAPCGAASTACFQGILVSSDDRTLDQRLESNGNGVDESDSQVSLCDPANMAVTEFELPFDLSEGDRSALEEVLPKLPVLRYPMSEEESGAFMTAYCELKDHPPWVPILVTSATLVQRKEYQDEVMRKHQRALRKAFQLEKLNAVDRSYVRVLELSIDCYFPRDQAIAYLRWNGMDYSDQEADGVPKVIASAPAEETVERSDIPAPFPIKRKLDAKTVQEIRECYEDLKKKGIKDYTRQVAKKFCISSRYVRMLVQKPRSPLMSCLHRLQK